MKCLKNHLHCVVTTVWKDELILIKETPVFDEVGNQIMQETLTTVFCDVKSVSRSEFYNASSVGLKPTLVFKVHLFEYENEELVEYEGIKYNVIRTYIVDSENIELTCERVIGNGY